jgi:predicted esterase
MRTLLYFVLFSCAISSISAQMSAITLPGQPTTGPGSTEHYKHTGLIITDCAADANGFWLFEPAAPSPKTAPVIIFMHGYGAYNPMVYGKWIKHLVAQGNIVIYPRYQYNLIIPKTDKFPETAAKGILDAIVELKTNGHIEPDLEKVVYIGHSYGGTINAYLGVFWESMGLPKPAGMVLAQPGTSLLNGVLLEDYAGLPADMNLLCIAGTQDYVVGDKLAKLVFETAIHTTNRNYVVHWPDTLAHVTSTHHEPYALDYDLDNGIRNYTANRCIKTSQLDAVDFYGFWKLADALIYYTREGKYKDFAFGNTPEQRSLGADITGRPIREMQVFVQQNVENEVVRK